MKKEKAAVKKTAKQKREYLTVIPAYNEEETIREVVEKTIPYTDVCVVDDASKDTTPAILQELVKKFGNKLHVIRHEKNTHIPGGIQDGMKYAVAAGYDWVITMDAGMSHNPDELGLFTAYGQCDLLIGARKHVQNVPFYRKVISFLGARAMNYSMSGSIFNFIGPGIGDCTSGFRRYSRKAFTEIAATKLKSVSFDFHMEALYLVHQMKGSIEEIGIRYVFSNSSFNRKVLKQAVKFALGLIANKFR